MKTLDLLLIASALSLDKWPNFLKLLLIRDCTAITTDILLVNYSGSVELRNITNITRLVAGNSSSVTSLDLPDLESVSEALDFEAIFASEVREVVSPVLGDVAWFGDANAPSLSFPSLRNVTESFALRTGTAPKFPNNETTTPIELSFPVLESTGRLGLLGNVETLSVPNLTTATRIDMHIYKSSTGISFPRLTGPGLITTWFEFSGSITNLSLPALSDFGGHLSVRGSVPIRIELGLESVRQLDIDVDIESIDLPLLTEYGAMALRAQEGFDYYDIYFIVILTGSGVLNP
ncbi:hypothetical protein BJX70DRAFT_395180 [Aspergillus crustosus]